MVKPLNDKIAQVIRQADGSHTLGAGALGEVVAQAIDADPIEWLASVFDGWADRSITPVCDALKGVPGELSTVLQCALVEAMEKRGQ